MQLFVQPGREKDPICGVVGRLQFEVLTYRLEHEYGAKIQFDVLPYEQARWIDGIEGVAELTQMRVPLAVADVDERAVALFHDMWEVERAEREYSDLVFHRTSPIRAGV